jgi:peptidoglycan-N-acetylglucosamine deacetylase
LKQGIWKKLALVLLLIGVSTATSIFYNYKATGVLYGVNKKLPIYCVDTNDKKIAISFDASWGNDNTQKLLEILTKYNVKATFFLVGAWVDEHPDLVIALDKSGQEIGNHSNMHPDMTQISRDKIIKEIAVDDAKIRNLIGKDTVLFRCPSGSYNDNVIQTVADTNHYCIQWDVDSVDWKEQGADLEYNRVISKVRPGSIILFHTNAKYTSYNLPRIIEKLKSEGYKFVTVGDLIYKENYKIDYSGKQILK